jgi:hypothetical protein
LLEKLLVGLSGRFDDDGVKIDRSVHNPARIVRLHGTLAAKGDNTKERPHRFSKIVKAPESLEAVSAEKLRVLVWVKVIMTNDGEHDASPSLDFPISTLS